MKNSRNINISQVNMEEVTLFRVILTFLLVVYHSFCFYRGSWGSPIDSNIDIPSYTFIANFSYSFLLEGFTFLSGFIFAFQLAKRPYSFKLLFDSKIRRLYLPALFWGIVYFLLFGEFDVENMGVTVMRLLKGAHHLWYLPMLFFCFLLFYILRRFINGYIILIGALCLTVLNLKYLPFSLGYTAQYFFFFVLGAVCFDIKKLLSKHIYKLFFVSLALFILFFALYYQFSFENNTIVIKIIRHIERLGFKIFGILFTLSAISILLKNRKLNLIVLKIASLSMGIYIFHQMILDGLYYHTDMANILGVYLLPFVAFIIALSVSLLLALIVKKIPLLKKII